jgi:hypothetical protein
MDIKKLFRFASIAMLCMIVISTVGAACPPKEKTNPDKFVSHKIPGVGTLTGERLRDNHGHIIKDDVKLVYDSPAASKQMKQKGQAGLNHRMYVAGEVINYAISNGAYLTLQHQDETAVAQMLLRDAGTSYMIFSGRV